MSDERTSTMIIEKECTKCSQTKPFDKFDRGENRCKSCRRAYHRGYSQRPENKKRSRARDNIRRMNPVRVEYNRKYQRKYYHRKKEQEQS